MVCVKNYKLEKNIYWKKRVLDKVVQFLPTEVHLVSRSFLSQRLSLRVRFFFTHIIISYIPLISKKFIYVFFIVFFFFDLGHASYKRRMNCNWSVNRRVNINYVVLTFWSFTVKCRWLFTNIMVTHMFDMFESTSLLVYTLFFIIVAACFVFRNTEFVSNGLTVENLFEAFIVKEYNNFILHHIQRTSFTLVVHWCLPLRKSVTISTMSCDQYDDSSVNPMMWIVRFQFTYWARYSLTIAYQCWTNIFTN